MNADPFPLMCTNDSTILKCSDFEDHRLGDKYHWPGPLCFAPPLPCFEVNLSRGSHQDLGLKNLSRFLFSIQADNYWQSWNHVETVSAFCEQYGESDNWQKRHMLERPRMNMDTVGYGWRQRRSRIWNFYTRDSVGPIAMWCVRAWDSGMRVFACLTRSMCISGISSREWLTSRDNRSRRGCYLTIWGYDKLYRWSHPDRGCCDSSVSQIILPSCRVDDACSEVWLTG